MATPEILPIFIEPLNHAGLRYMVTGSLAAIAYGEPRLTLDVDLVLELKTVAAPAFPSLYPADRYYCPPADLLLVECGRSHRGHFNVIHLDTGYKADVYLAGQDPLHAWALERRSRIDVGQISAWFAPPEYVVLRKLQYFQEGGSEKHLHDIRGILRCSGDSLDTAWLQETTQRLGLEQCWKLCQEE